MFLRIINRVYKFEHKSAKETILQLLYNIPSQLDLYGYTSVFFHLFIPQPKGSGDIALGLESVRHLTVRKHFGVGSIT